MLHVVRLIGCLVLVLGCQGDVEMSNSPSDTSPRPPFDRAKAASLIGKYVLIGITYMDHKDTFIEQKQVHGRITSADEKHGFSIALEGKRKGEIFWLPPDLRPFQEAKAGEYRLRSTGEIVVAPDFLATWTINKPAPDAEKKAK